MADPSALPPEPVASPVAVPAPEPGVLPEQDHELAPADAPDPARHVLLRARSAPLGRIALAVAVLMVVAVVIALSIDGPGRYLPATVLALVADAFSIAAVVVGIVAVIRRRDRGAGIAAIVIAVLGNPLVLLYGLGVLA